ncbi:MAG TPA: YceI family protein [Sphingobacteriaceae bacterium]|nr:YceI family protein [Sphingobacteriaceae bacterium]
MKSQLFKRIGILTLLITGVLGMQKLQAQTNYQSNNGQVTIKGTSTLHDWDMKSSRGQTKATFGLTGDQVTSVTALSFTIVAESLKSDRNGLDKNAYKALNTDKHKQISFTMTSGTVTPAAGNKFKVTATGNLNISGNSKRVTLTGDGQYNPADKSITVTGSTKFKMSEFQVKPPVLMMGTIKTGDDITIDYQVKLNN